MLTSSDFSTPSTNGLVNKYYETFERNADIPPNAESMDLSYRLDKGFACRYQILRSGRRQITALVVPGDIFDCVSTERSASGSGYSALARCEISQHTITVDRRHRYLQQRDAIASQWLVSLGQRSSIQRLAHLFCEVDFRLARVRLSDTGDFVFPVCQADLGDMLGLSTVHINRSVQSLRDTGLVRIDKKNVRISDRNKLYDLALFDPGYLSVND